MAIITTKLSDIVDKEDRYIDFFMCHYCGRAIENLGLCEMVIDGGKLHVAHKKCVAEPMAAMLKRVEDGTSS
jgi:hypothetical protein